MCIWRSYNEMTVSMWLSYIIYVVEMNSDETSESYNKYELIFKTSIFKECTVISRNGIYPETLFVIRNMPKYMFVGQNYNSIQ